MSNYILQPFKGRNIRCLLFDCGETLWTRVAKELWYPLEQAGNQRSVTLLREHLGTEVVVANDLKTFGNTFRALLQEELWALTRQAPGYEPDFVCAVNTTLRQLGLSAVEAEVAEAIFEAQRMPIDEAKIFFEDTLTTLKALQERGFLLGIVTNRRWGGAPFMKSIRIMGLLNYFEPEHIAISADLGVRKPNPAIFLHTLQALAVAPEEAVMVGDSLHADVAGAQKLNMLAIWKPKPRIYTYLRTETAPLEITPDALINYTREQEKKTYQMGYEAITPDIIIEHLSDLLPIFVKAGPL